MNETSELLLKKLMNSRPKPKVGELKRFFTDVKKADIESLLAKVAPEPARKGARVVSPLEKHTKSGLRKVKGRAKDFLPYLSQVAFEANPIVVGKWKSKKTLKASIDQIEECFGSESMRLVDLALERFVAENDVSYRLAAS